MKRPSILVLMTLSALSPISATHAQSLRFGRLGEVTVFRQTPHPAHVALLLSGRHGWGVQDTAIAQALASADGMVLGVDLKHYLRRLASPKCAYPAGDLEALSQYAQKKLGFPSYVRPVIAGRGLGAAVAYGTVAQAPVGTFLGALGLDFCPNAVLAQPLCRGDGLRSQADPAGNGYRLLAGPLTTSWQVLNSSASSACDADRASSFVAHVPSARFTAIHTDAGVQAPTQATLALVRQAFLDLVQAHTPETSPAKPVTDLPLVEVPATVPANDSLVVMVSGDGGWAGIDRELAGALAARGYSIVGLNSLQYFWTRRTPDGAGHDLARILNYYLQAWNKQQVLLIGYSRGADVLPFMASRLPPELQSRIKLIALLGLGQNVDFEFHLSDWLPGDGTRSTALPTYPEVQKLRGLRLICIYGEEEKQSLCRRLTPTSGQALALKGGHHFDGHYKDLATAILNALPAPTNPPESAP